MIRHFLMFPAFAACRGIKIREKPIKAMTNSLLGRSVMRAFEDARTGLQSRKRMKLLDRKLRPVRKGRIWPYVGDRDQPAVVYDYTATRERAEPEEFLQNYRGYLQADAYVAYDSFFLARARHGGSGLLGAARRQVPLALDNDPSHMRTLLLMIAE